MLVLYNKFMNILLLDDHPMIVSFYEEALKDRYSTTISITKAFNCKEAYDAVKDKSLDYDVAIIDQSIPGYPEQQLYEGTDIIALMRRNNTKCYFILITGYNKKLPLYDIVRKTKPDGLVIKTDVTNDNFLEILSTILDGNKYHSLGVKECIADVWKNEIVAEDYNREILLYLANGFKMNELHNYIPLSASSIKKRITGIKKSLMVDEESNLVKEAIKRKLI